MVLHPFSSRHPSFEERELARVPCWVRFMADVSSTTKSGAIGDVLDCRNQQDIDAINDHNEP